MAAIAEAVPNRKVKTSVSPSGRSCGGLPTATFIQPTTKGIDIVAEASPYRAVLACS